MNTLRILIISIAFVFWLSSCVKEEETPTPIPTPPVVSNICNNLDVNKLTNKWWKNVKAPTQSVSYPSYYYNSNGKEHTQHQVDLTIQWNVGNWTLSCDTLRKFSPYSGNLTPNEVWLVITLNDSMLSVKNLSPAISAGTIQSYKSTP